MCSTVITALIWKHAREVDEIWLSWANQTSQLYCCALGAAPGSEGCGAIEHGGTSNAFAVPSVLMQQFDRRYRRSQIIELNLVEVLAWSFMIDLVKERKSED